MATNAQVERDLAAGARYVVSNEDAYEAFCFDRGLTPYDANGDVPPDVEAAWCALPNDELNEYVFPRSRDDLD